MKIAFVYDAVFPWITGGAQKRVWELARRLAKNHDVHWYGQKYWEGKTEIQREGVIFHGICDPKDLYVNDRRSISQALYFTTHLIPALSREGYDVIDCQEFPYFPCFVSRFSSLLGDTRLFITWYEVWQDYWLDYLGKLGHIGKLVERSVAKLNATHVATSKTTQKEVRKLGANDTRISPLGVDIEEIGNIDPVEKPIDILFGGRLIPEKNAELFVKAITELRNQHHDLNALIIGEGPDRKNVEDTVAEYNIKDSVEVIDFVSHDIFLRHIKAADVFAFPSQREGFGLVGLEALACGTPVVTSSHPQNAAQELVESGRTGYICSLNKNDLADKLLRAHSIDPEKCREFARQYDWDKIVNEMERYYKTAVSTTSDNTTG